jgi:GDP-fucose protein O-fucosyltransferase
MHIIVCFIVVCPLIFALAIHALRMCSMETVIAIAHATGRTLVLPPVQKMYLLGDSKAKQRNAFSFHDFYHMDRIASEHPGLDIISMDTFLERMKGQLHDVASGTVSFPPDNRTDWNGLNDQVKDQLNPWLRTVALMPEWDPNKCLAAFPDSQEANSIADLHKDLQSILVNGKAPKPESSPLIGHPTPVDAASKDRMLEDLAGRNELCIYDETLQAAPLIHFHGKKGIGARLLVHFYAFLFFEDYKQDLWMKRFIRDHVRYIDELQCAAARIVEAVRDRARSRDKSNTNGEFDTFHIRRGDFQYKATRVDADELHDMSKDILSPGSTVYLATDERDKAFFQPLKDHYDIVFLDDYMHLIQGLNTNYYGMLDQLIATRGRFFFGCWFSTFTGFINRIRGYHSDKDKLPGYEKGVIESYYYALRKDKMAMREYYPLKQAFYAREYPVSWRDLNHDVEEVLTAESR